MRRRKNTAKKTSASAEKKRKRIPRRDRFRRLKNKNEAVYRTPAFLKKELGITGVSESGVFLCGENFSKAYVVCEKDANSEIADLCRKLREINADYNVLMGKYSDSIYLILHAKKKDMAEALAWFQVVEKTLDLSGMSAEQRLEHYCKYASRITRIKCSAESYLMEPDIWKPAAKLEGTDIAEKALHTKAGYFAVVAAKRFPTDLTQEAFNSLFETEVVEAAYIAATAVADNVVADAINAEYLGIESVLPRLKRSTPVLHEILSRESGSTEDGGNFLWAGVYYLLFAGEPMDLEEKVKDFIAQAKTLSICTECIPLAKMQDKKEVKRTLAMFGLTGVRQERYQSFIRSEDVRKLIPNAADAGHKMERSYDVEEMRALFFDRKEDGIEKEQE